ncbi:MAG TPA: hypothetical protein PLV83_01935 [Bacilli bacterium]|nr:hypothetical protein [Bacilli bacterium]
MDNKEIYLSSLYDYYCNLLTDKQKSYFEDYHFNDYSLAEIAFNNKTSRNAIYKQIKETEKKLLDYEEKLKLLERANGIRKIISDLDEEIKEQIEELI